MSDDERRGQYFDLLMTLAKAADPPDPDLLDRIERVLGVDDARVRGLTRAERAKRYVCPTCGGRKSFYATHCIKCNVGTVGNAGGVGGDTRSPGAREAIRVRDQETAQIRGEIERPARVSIGEPPPAINVASLPPWRRRELIKALESRNGKKIKAAVHA